MPALATPLPLDPLNPARFDAPALLKRLASSNRALADGGFVRKHRLGRGNYYINLALNAVLQPQPAQAQPTPAAP